MAIARLGERLTFPDPSHADDDGLVAVGGDLSVARLIRAYRSGIFPWFEGSIPRWHSPDPRLVLDPNAFRPSRSLRAAIRRGTFEVRVDSAFAQTIRGCAKIYRPGQGGGTWITAKMEAAYKTLHRRGYAHSVESWSIEHNMLVGGLYGLELGRCFFGESMFSLEDNASKVALTALTAIARERGIVMIDCQVPTDHLMSMGAVPMPRAEFLAALADVLRFPSPDLSWRDSWRVRSSTPDWCDRI